MAFTILPNRLSDGDNVMTFIAFFLALPRAGTLAAGFLAIFTIFFAMTSRNVGDRPCLIMNLLLGTAKVSLSRHCVYADHDISHQMLPRLSSMPTSRHGRTMYVFLDCFP